MYRILGVCIFPWPLCAYQDFSVSLIVLNGWAVEEGSWFQHNPCSAVCTSIQTTTKRNLMCWNFFQLNTIIEPDVEPRLYNCCAVTVISQIWTPAAHLVFLMTKTPPEFAHFFFVLEGRVRAVIYDPHVAGDLGE